MEGQLEGSVQLECHQARMFGQRAIYPSMALMCSQLPLELLKIHLQEWNPSIIVRYFITSETTWHALGIYLAAFVRKADPLAVVFKFSGIVVSILDYLLLVSD